MASALTHLSLFLSLLTVSIVPIHVHAKTSGTATPSSPSPSSTPAPLNLTAILESGGQYSILMRLLNSTQVGTQIVNQLNGSSQGLTLLAPTDNAFSNLKPGALNGLSQQQQVALLLYHLLPQFYTLDMFQTVSNPVRTQATGNGGGLYNLNFTTATASNQVNVSTGVVETQIGNALRSKFPLAVYQVDKVLLPLDLFGPRKAAATAPTPVPSTATPTPKKSPSSSELPKSGTSVSSESSSAGSWADVGRSGVWSLLVGAVLVATMVNGF